MSVGGWLGTRASSAIHRFSLKRHLLQQLPRPPAFKPGKLYLVLPTSFPSEWLFSSHLHLTLFCLYFLLPPHWHVQLEEGRLKVSMVPMTVLDTQQMLSKSQMKLVRLLCARCFQPSAHRL